MIIWINGAFGAGKTSLAAELMARRPSWILFDPEYLGYAVREYVTPETGDFQDLPEWRHVVAETAIALRQNREAYSELERRAVEMSRALGVSRGADGPLLETIGLPHSIVEKRTAACITVQASDGTRL